MRTSPARNAGRRARKSPRGRPRYPTRRCLIEPLESRRLLADVSAPTILQWFEGSYATLEQRTADIFMAGYGAVWTPPPGRADTSDYSVGYDVYDRFDLGRPGKPTLYGTATGLQALADELHRAGTDLHVDFVLNHNGYSGTGSGTDRQAFLAAGGYPGFFLEFFDDPDGDFNSAYDYGDVQGRLAGLIDIAHQKNYTAVRSPVPGYANNIAAGTVPWNGRLANVAEETNRRFYPDIGHNTIYVYDPMTGEQNIPVHQFNLEQPLAGDPTEENGLGYLMRNAQWLVQVIGADGLRIDAAKHVAGFVLDYLDRAVYRQNPRLLLDGSPKHVFSYSEVYDGSPAILLPHVKKTINPNDPGRIGGNRDTLDFKLYFALKQNLEYAGQANAWQNIRDAALDVADDGLHNGSAGVLFVNNHDVYKPYELGQVAQAYVLMQPGNAAVYFNGKEFGDSREFPKEGNGDALSLGGAGTLERLVEIRNTHGQGDYAERWIDDQGLFAFERVSSAITLLSNRGDAGFDSRTLTHVGFAPGTHLIELTGNASDPYADPYNDIPEVVTVFEEGGVNKVNVRFPRNRRASDGAFTGRGYAIYGLPTPQSTNGLELTNVVQTLAGDTTPTNNYENGTQRRTDIAVIRADSFQVRLLTREVRLLGSDALRDIYADGDNSLLKLDGGRDVNGDQQVDFTSPGTPSYGFEFFHDKSSPLIGPQGIGGPRGDGEFLQTINTTVLEEGPHYLTARSFRHRTDGGPAVYQDFKRVFYVDRLPPNSAVASFEPYVAGVNENRDLVVRSLDQTADNVHVFLNLPAALSDQQILAIVAGGNQAAQIDRDLFRYGFQGVPHGNNVATLVSFEPTGTYNIQRVPGLFTSTIIGAGLGDTNFDGVLTPADIDVFRTVLFSHDAQFNAAADLNGDGHVDLADASLLGPRLDQAGADQATRAACAVLVADVTLGVSLQDSAIRENSTTIGTVTRNLAWGQGELAVSLTSSDVGEATVPATVTIPAQAAAAQFVVTGVDDGLPDAAQAVTIGATVAGYLAGQAELTVLPRPSVVVGRHVFYNRSAFDGNNAAADAADDAAIAPDKTALVPGQLATPANYTSYSRGINGIMADIQGLAEPAALDAAHFAFRVGNSNTPDTWTVAPTPLSVTVRPDTPSAGVSRVTLIWPDEVIQKKWLQVTVQADEVTGLAAPDVFYFGNAVGESGDVAGDTIVDGYDVAGAAQHPHDAGNPAAITDPYDFNRDTLVDAVDQALAAAQTTDPNTCLRMLDLRVPAPPEVSVTVSPASLLEDDPGQLTYTFTRSGPITEPVTITFRVTGTAAVPSDYAVSGAASFDAKAGTVAFAAGSATAVVSIDPLADDELEGDETAWLLVLPGADYAVGSPAHAAGTIVNDDTGTLIVTRFLPTDTGFVARFGRDLDPSVLNLYDSASQALGAADVTVTGAAHGAVRGSLVVSADQREISFVQTGGLLEPDTYTVTLFSGATRFREPTGGTLDGNADGTVGDDYQTTFTVSARPAGTVTVSLPDLARGAGQGVNIPNTASGLPIRLDNAAGVTSLAVDLVYDQTLLAITAATLAAGLPSDWSVVNPPDTSTPGVAKIRASGTTPLSGTDVEIVRLTAAVPSAAPYGAVLAIRLENVSVNDGAIPAVGDVAVHKAAYLGDADSSGIHSSADAFLTVQAALGLASGFAAHAWTDPRIVGDADGSGVLSAADAFLIVQEGLGLSEPFVPDNPHLGVTPVGGGVDPQFQIDVNVPAGVGGLVSVPVNLAIEPAATNVGGFDFDLFFDPSQLTIQLPGGVSAGADTAGWAVSAILVAPGQLRVGMVSSNGRPLAPGLREIASLQLRVEGGEARETACQAVPDGLTTLPTLRPPITDHRLPITAVPDGSETYPTWLDIEPADPGAGGYAWTAVDGSVAIAANTPPRTPQVVGGKMPAAAAGEAWLLDVRDELLGALATDILPLESVLTDLAGDRADAGARPDWPGVYRRREDWYHRGQRPHAAGVSAGRVG